MKRVTFILVVCMLFVASVAVAAPYWLPRQYGTNDQQITTTKTIIYDGSIYYKGVTAGDRLDLRNGTSGSATAFYSFIAPAANGTFDLPITKKNWVIPDGVYFDVTLTGGVLGISLDYSE